MRVSQHGIDFIKSRESFSDKPYYCAAGKLTIGYGHVILPGEKFTTISKEIAQKILLNDLESFEEAVNRFVKVALTQAQYDALVSFAFNAGAKNFITSTLLKKLNASDYAGAAKELDKWVYVTNPKTKVKEVCDGLVNRRNAEQALFSEA